MLKKLVIAILFSTAAAGPALAFDPFLPMDPASTADTGDIEHTNWRTTQANSDYRHQGGWGNLDLAGQGWSAPTNTQGAFSSPNAPRLTGTPGFFPFGSSSGAASSAPIRGTMYAPGNLALRQMGKHTLPPTRLEGFVRNSGKAEEIYGDEGEYLPPIESFAQDNRIEAKLHAPDLTTGHRSALPSAWE